MSGLLDKRHYQAKSADDVVRVLPARWIGVKVKLMGALRDRSFGELLRTYRQAAGLSQEALANRARMSTRGISDLERGVHRAPYRETVAQLVSALMLEGEQKNLIEAAARERDTTGPATTRPAAPHNLTEEPTSFIGRAELIADIQVLLRRPEVRMMTLTGPGGSGKTRLGLRVAATLLDQFSDGVYLVALAPLTDPAMVPAAIMEAIGLEERADAHPLAILKAALRDKAVLLVMDNFEHVLDASWLLPELLEECPRLNVLVTSRTVLRLSWERVYPVAPLTVPDPPHAGSSYQALSHYEGVALFIERATASSPKFTVTNSNAPAIAEICYRLDGLPLAIELAAARIRMFPPQALLGRLSSRLTVLVGGARDQPDRQQTLRAAIDWSYSLLSDLEQRLFTWLSVFRGGCTLEAVEAVCATDDTIDIITATESLVDKSLLAQGPDDTGGEPRFRTLETIREYAQERLTASSDVDRVRTAHATYFVELVERAAAPLATSQRDAWLDRLEAEHENLRASLQWIRDRSNAELGLRLALGLSSFWQARGYLTEGRHWLNELVAMAANQVPDRLQAAALRVAGSKTFSPDLPQAAALTERSVALYRAIGDRHGLAEVLHQLGDIAFYQADYALAAQCLQESEVLAREIENTELVSRSLWSLASLPSLADGRSEPVSSSIRQSAQERLADRRRNQDPQGVTAALEVLLHSAKAEEDVDRMRQLAAELVAVLRDPEMRSDPQLRDRLLRFSYEMTAVGAYPQGVSLLEEGIFLAARTGERRDVAHLRNLLAQFAREQGDYDRADELLVASMDTLRELGDLHGLATALISLGDVARDRGQAERTVDHSEQALALARQLGDELLAGYALHNLGVAAWQQRDYLKAGAHFEVALEALSAIVDGRAEVLTSIGLMALDQKRAEVAFEACASSIDILPPSDLPWLLATNLEGLAGARALVGQWGTAATLYGAAEQIRRESGTPAQEWHRMLHQRLRASVRRALGTERFAQLVADGAGLSRQDAVRTAVADRMNPERSSTAVVWRGFRS